MKKTFLVRVIFWVLLVLSVVAGVWWILYLPYDEDALYRAIPPNAFIVSKHDDLAQRLPDILGNNAVKKTISMLGDNSISADALARDKSLQWMCDHFAFKKTLVAFVPYLGPSVQATPGVASKQAWIFSSWAGGNVQFLKRGLITREMSELKKKRLKDGQIIWCVAGKDIDTGKLNLSLAVYDGVLLGCLAEDPDAVRYLVYRIKGRISQPAKYFNSNDGLFNDPAMADRVWISKWLLRDLTDYNDIKLGLKNISVNELYGRAYIGNIYRGDLEEKDVPSDVPVTCRDISRILKVKPELLMISNLKELEVFADMPVVKDVISGVKPYDDIFSANAPVFVGLFGGDVSGRIMGLRVPTVVVGVKVKESAAIIANIDTILDAINTESGFGLIPSRMGVGETAKIGINSTRGGIYNSISIDQRPAIKTVGDWLILASNANALDDVIVAEPDMAVSTALWPVWMPEDIKHPGSSYMWSELRPAGKCIRNALAVWSLSLSVSGGKDKVAKKKMIRQTREVIAALQEMGDGTVWVRPQGGGVVAEFRLKTK